MCGNVINVRKCFNSTYALNIKSALFASYYPTYYPLAFDDNESLKVLIQRDFIGFYRSYLSWFSFLQSLFLNEATIDYPYGRSSGLYVFHRLLYREIYVDVKKDLFDFQTRKN